MDTIRNQRKKRRESGRGLAKRSRDKHIDAIRNDEIIMENGEVITMAPDLKGLPEFDWDDPKNQEWINEQDMRFRKTWDKYFKDFTGEDISEFVDLKISLLKKNPTISSKEAWNMALKAIQTKKQKSSS